MHLEQHEREGEAFLRRIITTDDTWAKAYELKLKSQSNIVIGVTTKSKVRLEPM